jgi:hypothetical protein
MVLDDNIILQADATVIAGLLILLTVAYNLAPRSPSEYVGFFALATVRSLSRIIIGVVIFFSASAILVTLGNISSSYTIPLYHYSIPSYHYTIYLGSYTIIPVLWGKWTMIFGFGVLAVGISWLLLSKATRSFEYIQRGKDKTGDH